MKFRTPIFQVSRDPPEDGFKSTSFKMPNIPVLRERRSKPAMDNGADNKSERPPSRPGTGFLRRKRSSPKFSDDTSQESEDLPPVPTIPFLKKKRSMPNLGRGGDDATDESQSPAMKQALRDLLQRTGTNIREATAKVENSYQQKKSTVVETPPIQNKLSFDAGDDILERVVKASKDEKRTPKSFEKKRNSPPLSSNPPLVAPTPPFESLADVPRPLFEAPADTPPPPPSELPADVSEKLLSVDQVRAMCIGAPSFGVEEGNGRFKPQVIFRESNAESSSDFLSDHKPFGHPSFASCTFGLDSLREQTARVASDSDNPEETKPTLDLTEIPSMLSADGLDAGAVGFGHFLQLPIADDFVREDEFDLSTKRKFLKSNPEEFGLRPPNIEVLIHRLTELGQLHAVSKVPSAEPLEMWNETIIEGMGEDLFGKLLSADMGITSAGTGSVSMETQVRALQKVLRTSGLWYDFALVDWRTRIGQLLWETSDFAPSPIDEDEIEERDVLFLQITLASELLVRINGIRSMMDSSTPIVSERQMDILDSLRTTKINWDLVLAKRFLENIIVSSKKASEIDKKTNRTSLFHTISLLRATKTPHDDVHLSPRRGDQQLGGLVHFAEALQWPHAQELPRTLDKTLDMDEKYGELSNAPSTYLTPMSSPPLQVTPVSRSGSFGLGLDRDKTLRGKGATLQSVQLVPVHNSATYFASFEACGWLSRSWLSGLVMPGEAASHFLMCALLEHTPKATTRLGEKASLYGGFVYGARSYWSKSCVVGRVLAAKKGAVECMEWISVPELGKAQEDGWIDLAVEEMPGSKSRPRIMNTKAVSKDSELLHNNDAMEAARVGDFTWPIDGPLFMGNEIKCQGLSFSNLVKPPEKDGELITSSIATVTFGSSIKRKLTVVEIPLFYDACFVSSYPCHPKTIVSTKRPHQNPLKAHPATASPRPASDGKENKDPEKHQSRPTRAPQPVDSGYASKETSASTINFPATEKEQSISVPLHPLPIDYHYDIVPVSTLFTSASETQPRAPSSGGGGGEQGPEMQAAAKEVMVLDCRGAEDLELFARAWCAKVGENAVIGKSGRTCLACCIREARALGFCVVIRT